MNIMWHSAPAYFPTGYGVQTRGFAHRVAESEHDIAIITTTLGPGIIWEGLLHLPGGTEAYSVDGLLEWVKRLEAELVVTLFDVWVLPENLGEIINQVGAKWAPISPIDHDPIPPEVLKRLIYADYPIAMSKYAEREMKRVGLEPTYIPHGVETNVFLPIEPNKSIFLAEDMFVVGVVATNIEIMDRKGWRPTLEAFGRFHQEHPNSRFYAHCNPSLADGGYDLTAIASEYGFKVYAPDMWQLVANGIPDTRMAEIYSSFDVMMMLTRGEGFGLPLIEAQACGTPVIVTDFTSPADLVGAGWKIPITGKRWTPMNSWFAEPDVDAAVAALNEAYELWEAGQLENTYQIKARAFAKQFDFDVIFHKHMLPFLEKVDGDIRCEKAESDGRGRQEAVEQLPEEGMDNSEQRPKPDRKREYRRKKSQARP